eukprot:gene13981-16258_t
MQASEISTPIKSSMRQHSDHDRHTHRSLSMVVDLCLYRVVAERCGGQVLPFGVRQMIKDFAWMSFDNETLKEA